MNYSGNKNFINFGNTGYLDQNVCIWPGDYNLPEYISANESKYCAFAIGFWGFHFFRASVEHDYSIKNESLEILMTLLKRLGQDKAFRGTIRVSKPHSFIKFKKNIIKRISLNLGDSLGSQAQWMVLFGFNAAFVYSSLVGLSQQNNRTETLEYLQILTKPMHDLLESARKAKVDCLLLDRISQHQQCLQHSNSMPLACDLYNILHEQLALNYHPTAS